MNNKSKTKIVDHYRKLWFFNFNRLKNGNYGLMREYFAQVVISEIEEFVPFEGKKVLDIGGARGELCKVMSEKRGCDTVNLEPAPYEYGQYSSDFLWSRTVEGFADKIPFKNNEFDIVICRSVIEHILPEKQQLSLDEMYRVTKPGGICYVTVPPWFNPLAGHGLKPFHYLPFRYAKLLAQKAYGKNIEEKSWRERRLFKITFNKMSKLVDGAGFKVKATRDTHFRLHFLTRIPIIREIAVPSVAFILSKAP